MDRYVIFLSLLCAFSGLLGQADWLANLMIDGSDGQYDLEFPSEAKNGKPSGQSTYLRIASPWQMASSSFSNNKLKEAWPFCLGH